LRESHSRCGLRLGEVWLLYGRPRTGRRGDRRDARLQRPPAARVAIPLPADRSLRRAPGVGKERGERGRVH
jgi:hypothetical protein